VGLKETLQNDRTESMRSGDKVALGTIRMVLTAITNEEVAEEFAKAGREDKAAEERAEGEVIAKYLPAQLSEDEIKKMISAAIASTGAAGPADMGKVMGAIKPQIAGKADGSIVSSLVKAALTGGN
jgi:hypothetical protein